MASNFKQPPSRDFMANQTITTAKYNRLLAKCRDKGWKTWNFPVKIRCRGFLAVRVMTVFCTGSDRETRKKDNEETRPNSREVILLDLVVEEQQ